MHAKLVCKDRWSPDRDFDLEAFPAVIGRSDDADCHLDDRWTSRKHCQLSAREGHLIVRDLGSRNGTYVNDLLVEETELSNGDSLRIGLSSYEVTWEP